MRSIKMLKMINGEFCLTAVMDITEDGMYVLEYPSVIMPVPQQQGQVRFGKYLPFSDYSKEILLNPACIAVESEPDDQMLQTYEQWTTQMKAQASGIVMANQIPKGRVPQDGSRADFSKLNM